MSSQGHGMLDDAWWDTFTTTASDYDLGAPVGTFAFPPALFTSSIGRLTRARLRRKLNRLLRRIQRPEQLDRRVEAMRSQGL